MKQLAKTFNGTPIRVKELDGMLCVRAEDIARAIGYDLTANYTRIVKEKYIQKVNVDSHGRAVTYIEEPGVWQSLASTRKDAAEPFQDWLYEEALPEIRKTGSYNAGTETEGSLTDKADTLTSKVEALQGEIRERQRELDAANSALSRVTGDARNKEGRTVQIQDSLPSAQEQTRAALTRITDSERKLKLDRPLVLFDLETTGPDPEQCRIVEIAAYRIEPSGEKLRSAEHLVCKVDPGIEIPTEATAVHGISTEDVSGHVAFADIAEDVEDLFRGADLKGYNIVNFDIPVLSREMRRAGREWSVKDRAIIDSYILERILTPRTLSATHERYTGAPFEDVHTADADIKATWRVLQHQIRRLPTEEETVSAKDLMDIARGGYLDITHRLMPDGDRVRMCFGKHKGKTLGTVASTDPGYITWMLPRMPVIAPHVLRQLDGWE